MLYHPWWVYFAILQLLIRDWSKGLASIWGKKKEEHYFDRNNRDKHKIVWGCICRDRTRLKREKMMEKMEYKIFKIPCNPLLQLYLCQSIIQLNEYMVVTFPFYSNMLRWWHVSLLYIIQQKTYLYIKILLKLYSATQ